MLTAGSCVFVCVFEGLYLSHIFAPQPQEKAHPVIEAKCECVRVGVGVCDRDKVTSEKRKCWVLTTCTTILDYSRERCNKYFLSLLVTIFWLKVMNAYNLMLRTVFSQVDQSMSCSVIS